MTELEEIKVGGLLLAAGGSSRFGSPKQLCVYDGMTLIRRAAESLVGSGSGPNIVVLGAETEGSRAELAGFEIEVIENTAWGRGMGSSISVGVRALLEKEADLAGILITLVDQPLIPREHLGALLAKFRSSGGRAAASRYDGILGAPAVFGTAFFDDLCSLDGDKGAQGLLRRPDVEWIDLRSAGFDLDTPSDLHSLS